MKVVACTDNLAIDQPGALVDLDLPDPEPGPHDLLVRVRAVSMNPVDVKTRLGKPASAEEPRILGWDASGEVVAVGNAVSGFAVGDEVWYSGQIDRPGTNAELHRVDARIAAHKPKSLDHAAAAAMPLTTVTSWECLFDRLGYTPGPSEHNAVHPLLLINGAGGLGSMALQLARLAGIEATATAGREETRAWCREMGAARVVGHDELAGLTEGSRPRILCAHDTDRYFDEMARLVGPQGLVCAVASTRQPHDLQPMMAKSAGFVWELIFTRSLFRTADMAHQGEILRTVAERVDAGELRTTLTETLEGLSAETFVEAHRRLESGRMIGKLVVVLD